MTKNKYFLDFTNDEIRKGLASMKREIAMFHGKDKELINVLFARAWRSFINNEWSYDGATFVPERYTSEIFELAAFIHDWRNSMGYVGSWVDNEFIDIMIATNYPFRLIKKRYILMRFTFVNVLIHKVKGNYQKEKPSLIFSL